MELMSSKWLRRISKKGPKKEQISQQWRHLGDRRHLRKQKRPQRGPMGRPNGPQVAIGDEKKANMGQKRVEIGDPGEVENRALAQMRAQFST